jgi:hypothetical protein
MVTYAIHCLVEGQIAERFEIEAGDDREALALLTIRGERGAHELWQGSRLVQAFNRPAGPGTQTSQCATASMQRDRGWAGPTMAAERGRAIVYPDG